MLGVRPAGPAGGAPLWVRQGLLRVRPWRPAGVTPLWVWRGMPGVRPWGPAGMLGVRRGAPRYGSGRGCSGSARGFRRGGGGMPAVG